MPGMAVVKSDTQSKYGVSNHDSKRCSEMGGVLSYMFQFRMYCLGDGGCFISDGTGEIVMLEGSVVYAPVACVTTIVYISA